jgi:methionyl-tRNA synthetase
MKKFYITTSIAYTNAPPHIGFALEAVQADVLARSHRSLGEEVFFLTGTDEHGQKICKASELAGQEPEFFVNEISAKFKQLAQSLDISNDDFIRTTDQTRHWPSVVEAWKGLQKNGDIYKKKYQGLYCLGCEAFITQKDLVNDCCKIHKKEPELVEEENYFFRLSKYSKEIEKIIEKDEVRIIPEGKKNEMLSFVRQGLEDISFSRPRKDLKWGVPVPGDDSQTIYVWADALVNYISILGYPGGEKFKKYWPADVHCVGKDILKFHATIWLGMLLSLGIDLPKTIFVHGHITSGGQKMSKSLGNVVSPFDLIEKYGQDALRYFLLREIPSSEDGDYSEAKFIERYNADLAGGIGNLVARVITLATKFNVQSSGKIKNSNLRESLKTAKEKYQTALEGFRFNEALVLIWDLISSCDKIINTEKPWAGGKEELIGDLMAVIGEISGLLKSFVPKTAERIEKQLKDQKSEPLFPRI